MSQYSLKIITKHTRMCLSRLPSTALAVTRWDEPWALSVHLYDSPPPLRIHLEERETVNTVRQGRWPDLADVVTRKNKEERCAMCRGVRVYKSERKVSEQCLKRGAVYLLRKVLSHDWLIFCGRTKGGRIKDKEGQDEGQNEGLYRCPYSGGGWRVCSWNEPCGRSRRKVDGKLISILTSPACGSTSTPIRAFRSIVCFLVGNGNVSIPAFAPRRFEEGNLCLVPLALAAEPKYY